jgi:hypothetical protein
MRRYISYIYTATFFYVDSTNLEAEVTKTSYVIYLEAAKQAEHLRSLLIKTQMSRVY